MFIYTLQDIIAGLGGIACLLVTGLALLMSENDSLKRKKKK
jgi:hypothetical protein